MRGLSTKTHSLALENGPESNGSMTIYMYTIPFRREDRVGRGAPPPRGVRMSVLLATPVDGLVSTDRQVGRP